MRRLFRIAPAALIALALHALPAFAADPTPRLNVGDTTYIGDFRFEQPSGQAAGQGRVEWRNGDYYEGPLVSGQRSGHGVFVSTRNGFRYEGDWLEDQQSGQGRMRFANGDVYVGEMKDGLFDGQGTYQAQDGSRYAGEWKHGLRDGQGTLTFPDGDNWEGRFSHDQRTRDGQMNFIARPTADANDEIAELGRR